MRRAVGAALTHRTTGCPRALAEDPIRCMPLMPQCAHSASRELVSATVRSGGWGASRKGLLRKSRVPQRLPFVRLAGIRRWRWSVLFRSG